MISAGSGHPLPATAAPVVSTWRSLLGGAVGAVVCLAVVLTLGVVALAPLGARAVLVGVPAAFACVIVSATIYALFSRNGLAAGGPSSPTALIVSVLVGQVLRVELAVGGGTAVPVVLAALSATVMLMGLLQFLMAGFRFGRLARFVPQPVLAGFMNGVAVLVVLAQVPALQGVERGAWLLGLGTAGLIWLLASLAPRWPAALLGMLLGVLGFHVALAVWPGFDLGPTLQGVDAGQFWPGLLALWGHPTATLGGLLRHAPLIGVTALLLALVGSMESLLNLRAADQQSGERSDESQELRALGLANLGGGLLGALPMHLARSRSAAIALGGGRGFTGALGAVLCSALIIGLAGDLMAYLPRAVLAGVMLTVAVSLLDRRSIRQLGQRLRGSKSGQESLLIMGLVCLLTVWQGPGAGVALGVLLSMAIFVRGMNRSLLRARFGAHERSSRRVYPPALEQVLRLLRPRVVVLELEGALFFGSADRLNDEAGRLPAGTRFLILDLRRVLTIDESGAMMLHHLHTHLARQGCYLLLAGVGPGSLQRRQILAFWPEAPAAIQTQWHLDLDQALEAAERLMLQEHEATATEPLGESLPLAQCSLLRQLSEAQQSALVPHLQRLHVKAGEHLFSEGDPGIGVYVLTRGSVSIVSPGGQRYASFSPGTMLGELAMLDGQGRSAHAVADQDTEVYLLSREALDAVGASDPQLCSQLYRNMALHLAERLRVASSAWRSAAG